MLRSTATLTGAAALLLGALFLGCTPTANLQTQQAAEGTAKIDFATGSVSATQHPLVAKYSFYSPVAATVSVEFGPDTTYGLRTSPREIKAGGGAVDVLVAGMRAFTTYHMRARVQYEGGTYLDNDHVFTTTGPAASALFQTRVTRSSGTKPAPGIELLDLVTVNGTLQVAVVDLDGNVIWYYAYDSAIGFPYSVRPMPNGNMAILMGTNKLREVDLAGETVRETTAADMNARLATAGKELRITGFHHEALPLPNGHIILVCEEVQTPTGASQAIRGDALIDVDSELNPKWVWSTFDHLDVGRHPMDVVDWTHTNAVAYSEADGSLLVSMRNQHWILKIDYANGTGDGSVLWRLGDGGDFTLSSGKASDWFFGQHFPEVVKALPGGKMSISVFDNRATSQDGVSCATESGTCFNRPVIVNIDEKARTASLEWSLPLSLYSLWGGSMVVFPDTVEFDIPNPFPTVESVVMEVDRASMETIWELRIINQAAYRAYRIPSLYPGVQW